MNIGIDGFPLGIPFPCGTLNYARNLVSNLSHIDKKNNYFIFSSKPIQIPTRSNFHLIRLPNFIPFFKRHLFLNNAVHNYNLDIFHYLLPHGSAFLRHPNIITTVHDTKLELIYGNSAPIHKYYSYLNQYFALNYSSTFITVSRTVKIEIENYLKKKRAKHPVYQIYNGVGTEFKRIEQKKSYGKFFTCMADFSPRKNFSRILAAFSQLTKVFPQQISLVVITSTSESFRKIAIILQSFDKNIIRIINRPSQSQLVQLYNQSLGFLYPSLYEGFGLPILEAMACGCPVITSDFGAMKEVSANAALHVNPYSTESINEAMVQLLRDKKLTQKLSWYGLIRATNFNWQKTALQTLAVYEKRYRQ